MRKKKIKFLQFTALCLLSNFIVPYAGAEEIIIQQEKISVAKCLSVIDVSENKLSVAAEIQDTLDQKRIASFKLTDGTLTIVCDKVKSTITVSTNKN